MIFRQNLLKQQQEKSLDRNNSASFERTIKEIWPLIPAGLYLLGFFIVVLSYLLYLGFAHAGPFQTIFPSLITFSKLFAMSDFWKALVNTTVFVCIGTPLELIVGVMLALVLYRSFRLRGLIRSIFMIPLAIPALVTAILLYILFDFPGGHINYLLMGKYGWFPALIADPINWRGSGPFALGVSLLGKVWRDMPISMLIILSGLNAIDPELFDAAKTMGAGWRQQLTRIVIPLIIPSMSAVVLLRSIEMWKEFIFPFVLAGRHNLLGTLIESMYNNWGKINEASAVALVLVVCICITTLFFLAVAEISKRLLMRR